MRKAQRQLKNFLRSRGLLTRFKLNIRNGKNNQPNPSSINFNREGLGISSAFVWKETPEGHKFWGELDEKFKAKEKYPDVKI